VPRSAIISHTAAALAPVLAAGPLVDRKPFDPAALEAKRKEDVEINDVGRDTKMPWEVDGRRWHTRDRVSRTGEPCRWDGRILDLVEERIQKSGAFLPTNWNARTVVEITGQRKIDGWFFHALTGEKWLLRLKFRTAKKTFNRDALVEELGLLPLDDMDDIEAYGRRPRVRCKTLRGPWQEVQIDAHAWEEIDTPAFWTFVDNAIAGFRKFAERTEQRPDDVMPWKVLGQKWHLARKGFPPGKKVAWTIDVLEELLEMLGEAAPKGQFLWNNQQVVHFMAPGRREPWASVFTKRLAGVDLILNGPKAAFALGRIAELGADRGLATDDSDRDQLKFRFVTTEDLDRGNLAEFLREHLDAVLSAGVR
jgi:excinuclease ABC subunit A